MKQWIINSLLALVIVAIPVWGCDWLAEVPHPDVAWQAVRAQCDAVEPAAERLICVTAVDVAETACRDRLEVTCSPDLDETTAHVCHVAQIVHREYCGALQ